jgi:putative ABC transport system permease protein
MALNAIWSNKMRSFLTVLGIVIGVVAFVVMVGLGQGTTSSVTSSIESMGTNLLTANIRGYRQSTIKLTLGELETLVGNGGVAEVAPTMTQSITAKAGTTTYDTTLMGTLPSYANIRDQGVSSGRFLKQTDVDNRVAAAVVGTEVAEELYGHTDVVGESLMIEGRTFTVVGLLESKGTSMSGSSDDQIIVPFSLAEKMFTTYGITTFYASASSSDAVTEAQATLNTFLLKKYKNDSDAFNIFNQSSMLESLSETTGTLTLMLGGIAGISLLVGGIGIMNIMMVSVSERTREIGIRKAIGAGRRAILAQFLIEALVISGLGGVIGLLISFGLSGLLTNLLSMSLTISASMVQIAIGFSMLIGIVFGLYPANKASRLRPIQALRYDG